MDARAFEDALVQIAREKGTFQKKNKQYQPPARAKPHGVKTPGSVDMVGKLSGLATALRKQAAAESPGADDFGGGYAAALERKQARKQYKLKEALVNSKRV
jgi:hypothetical protein